MFKKKTKEKYKVSETALNLLITEAMPKLKLTAPLSLDDVIEVANFYFSEEGDLANAKENYNKTIDEDRLRLVCKMVDEFDADPIDLEDLNSRLMKRN